MILTALQSWQFEVWHKASESTGKKAEVFGDGKKIRNLLD